MPLYEIVKRDGTREKVEGEAYGNFRGAAMLYNAIGIAANVYAPGTWLEVWRREGVGE
jgi:hypothetical protein